MTTQETAYTEIERQVKSFKVTSVHADEEIDKRVYVLYGLNEEEIKVVEGR